MKIFIINNVYNNGSTGKIVHDTKTYYESLGHSVMAAYGMGVSTDEPDLINYCTTIERYFYYFLWKFGHNEYKGSSLTVIRLAKAIESFNPDVVHLHCLNSFCIDLYGLLNYLSKKKIKVVITHHAEFYYTGSCPHAFDCKKWIDSQCHNCGLLSKCKVDLFKVSAHDKWVRMYKSFARFKTNNIVFTAVSPWVTERTKLSPITNRFKCITVTNGLDTSVFKHRNEESLNIIDKNIYRKVVFHSTAAFSDSMDDPKGGHFIIEIAKMNPSVLFVVASLHCNINGNVPNNIYLWGKAKSGTELAKLYSSADVTLICSRRETFSMVTAESLCCGTPVVGFKAGGPESIAVQKYSKFVEYGDIERLNNALLELLNKDYSKQEIAALATKLYSKEKMAEAYLNVYKELLQSE